MTRPYWSAHLLALLGLAIAPAVCPAGDQPQRFPEGLQGLALPHPRVTLSAPVDGILSEIRVKEGQHVRQGDILAVIDSRIVQAEVALARTEAESTAKQRHAEQERVLTEGLYRRMVQAHRENAVAAHELDEARVRLAQAKVALDAAKLAHRQARQRLDRELARLESHNIRAPFDGTIVHIKTTAGTSMTSRDEALSVADLRTLRAEMYLPLHLYGKLQTGKPYELIAGSPVARIITAKLHYVSPQVEAATESFRCVFYIDNRQLKLPAGFPVALGPLEKVDP